jgi:hypothetical protein
MSPEAIRSLRRNALDSRSKNKGRSLPRAMVAMRNRRRRNSTISTVTDHGLASTAEYSGRDYQL